MEKLVRASKFENKDAVLNSSHLFEAAVCDFYDFRDVDKVRDETLDAITGLREKLAFDAANGHNSFLTYVQILVVRTHPELVPISV
jgi:hypothetical protein